MTDPATAAPADDRELLVCPGCRRRRLHVPGRPTHRLLPELRNALGGHRGRPRRPTPMTAGGCPR